MLINLVKIELVKIFKKWRSYIGHIGILFMVSMLQINLFIYGENEIRHITRNLSDLFIISGNILNGNLIGNLILNSFFILFPLTIVLVAGEIFAGEGTGGTYRLIITRPVSRMQIILSKFLAGCVYIFSILIWMIFVSLVVSRIIFGSGELIVISDGINIFAEDDILWRFGLSYIHIFFSMLLVFTLSFMFSSLVENAIGPIIATMAVIIFFVILSQIPLDFTKYIKPYLFTNYFMDWQQFFTYDFNWITQLKSIGFLAAHSIVFLIITSIIFFRKDILS
ncbi:MAG: ABC transporter permease subunit [Ignavibacteriales bacterium]|nr:ABC transporter permease subunit [Ignavibacteriales bacterium]